MLIDVVSDTICPWCYIGKRRLERALEQRPDLEFDVRWRPFLLDATVPREGIDRRTYLRNKFGEGGEASQHREAIRLLGEKEGIAFAFNQIPLIPNTTDSHRLIRWAGTVGVQGAIVEGLFSAYFEQGRDIGDTSVLEWIAAQHGMDVDLVHDILSRDADRDLVVRECDLARRLGIHGVPAFIFANKFLVSGAQDIEALLRAIDETEGAMEESTTETPSA